MVFFLKNRLKILANYFLSTSGHRFKWTRQAIIIETQNINGMQMACGESSI